MYIDILLADENMISFNEFVDIDYKINSSDNNELLLGNVSAASLNFSIWNGGKQWNAFKFKGSKAYLYKDAERTKKIGVFNIEKVTKNKNTLNFESIDNMGKTDAIFKGIQTPFSLWELVNQICSQLDITLANKKEDFDHITQTYDNTNEILGKPCREILKYIGEVTTKYAIFDPDGKLFFSWYDLNANAIKKEITYNKLKDFARDEDLLYVSGVSCILENEEYLKGSQSSYDLRLTTDNPFLKPLNEAERNQILEDIYSRCYGMQYLSCDIALSTEDINIGDTLIVHDEDGNRYKILVTYLNINKIFNMKITSAGANPNRQTQSSSSSGGGETKTEDKIAIAKDENYKMIEIENSIAERHLNSLKIDGVTEKTSAYFNYSLQFNWTSTNDNTIKFKLYINDIIKEFLFKPTTGQNYFTWGEKLNLQLGQDGEPVTNNIKMTLDLSHNEEPSYLYIGAEKSILSVVAVGAKSAGANQVTNLEIKEDVERIGFRNETSLLNLTNIGDIIDFSLRRYIGPAISEQVNIINFKNRTSMEIQNINETKEVSKT